MSDKRLSWTFPGHGKDCGLTGFSTVGHSPGGTDIHVHRHSNGCVNRDCPSHYERWAARQAGAVVDRLGGQPFIQRVIVSFPPWDAVLEDSTEEWLQKLFHRCYTYLRFCGVTGGIVMFHAQRIPSRFNDKEDIQEGPHFHCLVDTMLDPERVLCIANQTGVDNDDNCPVVIKGMGKPKAMRKHVLYLLSHLGVPREVIPGGVQSLVNSGVDESRAAAWRSLNPALDGIIATRLHTIRWFGTWVRLKKPDDKGRFCAICEKYVPLEHWAPVRWAKYDVDPPDGEWIVGNLDEWVQVHQYMYGE